jgi:hypothetical protein
MSTEPLPTLFVSHGAPTLPLEDVPARQFLVTLGSWYRNVQYYAYLPTGIRHGLRLRSARNDP